MTVTLDPDVKAITDRLIALGYGTAVGKDIWPNKHLPATPPAAVNMIAVIPLSIRNPDLYDLGNMICYPGIQVQVRNLSYELAVSTLEAIRTALHMYQPPGYVICKTTRSRVNDVTTPEEINATNGPIYRVSVDFELTRAP